MKALALLCLVACAPAIAPPPVEPDTLAVTVVPQSCRGLKTISGPREHVERFVSAWCIQPAIGGGEK